MRAEIIEPVNSFQSETMQGGLAGVSLSSTFYGMRLIAPHPNGFSFSVEKVRKKIPINTGKNDNSYWS